MGFEPRTANHYTISGVFIVFVPIVSELCEYFGKTFEMNLEADKGYKNHSVFGGKVMRLVKALYSARQASRRFWEHLHKVL